jgi:mycothiol synthase
VAQLSWYEELTTDQAAEVGQLLAAAESTDGVAPVGEAVRLRMRPGATGSKHLLAHLNGELAGYAHVDMIGDSGGHKVAELAVHPKHRHQGVGEALVKALPQESQEKSLRIWAHGGHPDADQLAAKLGFRKVRELLRMRLRVDSDLPEPKLPDGITIRAFVPGKDEAAVVYVNHRAFDWHPEQGSMSIEDVRAKENEDWFDPDGFLLAFDAEGRLTGFHWTKVHTPELGEVYVVGVDPDHQGGGLGKALTLAGLRYLREQQVKEVMLYVESDNTAAVRVYTKLGFTLWDADVQYGR